MSNNTKQIAEQSFFVFVKDNNTKKVKKLALPADTQVGLSNIPASLQLMGNLVVSSLNYDVNGDADSTVVISNNVTIASITLISAPTSNQVNVSLPTSPKDGHLLFIKDATGTAGSTPIVVSSPSNALIDGLSSQTLVTAYETLALYWSNSAWHVLVTSSGGSSAPVDASYVLITNDATLTDDRALTVGSGLSIVDAGAGSTVTLDVASSPAAGTYTNSNITIDAYGRVTVAASGTPDGGADPGASYVVMGVTASLANERALTAGSGLSLTDTGAGGIVRFQIDNNVVATVSGTTFTGVVSASAGLSGSLQQVGPELSYLVAGSNITVTSQSNGQIIIASTATGGSDADWVDGGNKLQTTSSVSVSSFGSGGTPVYANTISQEAYFYVSGTVGLAGSVAKKSIFGGDVRISGSLTVGSSSIRIDTNAIRSTTSPSASVYFENDGQLSFEDVNISQIRLSELASMVSTAETIKQTFTYTGVDDTFIVPAGITNINVKLWGAGGGNGGYSNYSAGAGGYAAASLSVTPGESLAVVVGGAGAGVTGSAGDGGNGGYAGGGRGSKGDASGGGGGGYTGIFATSVSQVNALVIAGGGGGGTGYRAGGGGGGTNGSDGYGTGAGHGSAGAGLAGTQSAGGASGDGSGVPKAGSALTGGEAIGSQTVSSGDDGGGGGGGYYGGGGADGDGNGGGGGSGYMHPSRTTNTTLSTGADGNAGDDSRSLPPNTSDTDYLTAPANTGTGGNRTGGDGNDGGAGYVVISYNVGRSVAPWTEATAGNAAYITSSIAVGVEASASASAGQEAFTFFSGTIGLTGAAAKKSIFGGDVHVSGSIINNRKVRVTAGAGGAVPVTSNTDDVIIISGSSGVVNVYLPASPQVGEEYVVKDGDGISPTYNINVDGNGKNIDASTVHVISGAYSGVTVLYVGNNLWSKLPFHN